MWKVFAHKNYSNDGKVFCRKQQQHTRSQHAQNHEHSTLNILFFYCCIRFILHLAQYFRNLFCYFYFQRKKKSFFNFFFLSPFVWLSLLSICWRYVSIRLLTLILKSRPNAATGIVVWTRERKKCTIKKPDENWSRLCAKTEETKQKKTRVQI